MKKMFVLLFALSLIYGCTSETDNQTTTTQSISQNTVNNYDKLDEKIKIVVNNQEVIIQLYDNALAHQLLEAMPLDCDFNDYGNCEKAANVHDLISVGDTPLGYEPKPGDVVVYEPWGNFTVFYDEFRFSESLAPIGVVESGLDVLSKIDGSFLGHVEVMK